VFKPLVSNHSEYCSYKSTQHTALMTGAYSWNLEKVFQFQFPESVCIIKSGWLIKLSCSSAHTQAKGRWYWWCCPSTAFRPLLVTSLISLLVYPFFRNHCTLLIKLEMGKMNNQERMTWKNCIFLCIHLLKIGSLASTTATSVKSVKSPLLKWISVFQTLSRLFQFAGNV